MLETVKLYLDQEGCAFVLAADPRRVGEAVGEAYTDEAGAGEEIGAQYLDKIVQLPFWVPRMSVEVAEAFFLGCECLLHEGAVISPTPHRLLLDEVPAPA